MYALAQESGHVIWREQWYTFMSKVSLWIDLYMIWEDHVFIANVLVTNPMWEMMASNVIKRLANAATKLNIIVKIYKYRRL
jgi:hypothetical protein